MQKAFRQRQKRQENMPCRMSGGTQMAGTAVVSIPKSGLKGTAKKVFEVVASELIAKNLLDVVGVDLLVSYAREIALYHDMMRDLEKEGYTIDVETKFGTSTVVNPKRKVAESALATAKALAAEFGMTPASRSRVTSLMSDAVSENDFAEFEEV